jgi:hypothetical protein
MRVFADEFEHHRKHGPCPSCTGRAMLPVPAHGEYPR